MKRQLFTLAFVAVCGTLICAHPIYAQQSYDGKFDIAKLLSVAVQQFDTSKEDAVTLLDKQSVTWTTDGRLSATVHRIIWIISPLAIDEYGDVRLPVDYDHCTFTPLAVRTWREGRWWPSDSTGVVETLPFALNNAYDYTNMREMMCLFNGMEPRCIIELAYRIEDKAPYRKGADGLWLFQGTEPTVESQFELASPTSQQAQVTVSAGVPAPEHVSEPGTGLEVSRWRMGPQKAQPRPHTSDLAADIPHIAWSTWGSWQELGNYLLDGFQPDSTTGPGFFIGLDSVLRRSRTDRERAQAVADFIDKTISYVSYSEAYWWTFPRPADRTYSTAYGHALDRAILAAQLLRRASLKVTPMFTSLGSTPIGSGIPSLARFNSMMLRVQGTHLDAAYLPESSTLADFAAITSGHTVWSPGADDRPYRVMAGKGSLDVRLTLGYDKAKAKFSGSGLLTADSGLCPTGQLTGLKAEMKTYLNALLTGLLKGSTVTDFNPEHLGSSDVTLGFEFELAKPDSDDQKRITLTLGNLKGGIFDNLPGDVQLFQEDRGSAIHFPYTMKQRVELCLELPPNRVVYSPVPASLENEAGRFSVGSEVKDSQLVVVRELSLTRADYLPSVWPQLRKLLLAERGEKNSLIILRPEEDKAKGPR